MGNKNNYHRKKCHNFYLFDIVVVQKHSMRSASCSGASIPKGGIVKTRFIDAEEDYRECHMRNGEPSTGGVSVATINNNVVIRAHLMRFGAHHQLKILQ